MAMRWPTPTGDTDMRRANLALDGASLGAPVHCFGVSILFAARRH